MTSQVETETARMSVGRDYNTSSRYEYVVFKGEDVLIRAGCFKTAAQARKAGIKAYQALEAQ